MIGTGTNTSVNLSENMKKKKRFQVMLVRSGQQMWVIYREMKYTVDSVNTGKVNTLPYSNISTGQKVKKT